MSSTMQPVHFTREDMDEIRKYKPGGNHPVNPGQTIAERYRVFNKLGRGSFAITWLAEDTYENKIVALKINISAIEDNAEAQALTKVARRKGKRFVTPILDQFEIAGPNGLHQCMVLQLARTHLYGVIRTCQGTRSFSSDVARSMVYQLVKALEFLHDNGFVHGDLHTGNILVLLPEDPVDYFKKYSPQDTFGETETKDLQSLFRDGIPNNYPSHLMKPTNRFFDPREMSPENTKIIISDLGESCRPEVEPELNRGRVAAWGAPEEIFDPDQPRSYPTDIWTLGCTIYQILTLTELFDQDDGTDPNELPNAWAMLVGQIPGDWMDRWEHKEQYVLGNFRMLSDEDYREQAITRRLDNCRFTPGSCVSRMSREEQTALVDLLMKILTYNTSTRATIKDVLASEWIQKYARPSCPWAGRTSQIKRQVQHMLKNFCKKFKKAFTKE